MIDWVVTGETRIEFMWHDSAQWYDIVFFEYKLSWLCFVLPREPHPMEGVFFVYKLMVIP